MARKGIALLLAVFLSLCLFACDKTPDTDPPPSGGGKGTPPSGPSDPAGPSDPSGTSGGEPDGTYWTAVQYETYNSAFARTEVSTMPTEKWWADLYLNADGTAQFREVLGLGYSSCLLDGTWWLGADNTLRLMGRDAGGGEMTMDGRMEKGSSVTLETPFGNTFHFEPAERPAPGGELCAADLVGVWRADGEKNTAVLLNLESVWDDGEDGGHTLMADYYHAALLDTDAPEYRTEKSMSAQLMKEPLARGSSNELWSVRLFQEDGDAGFLVTLTDRNTLHLREYHERGEGAETQVITCTRSEGLLPEPLREAVSDDPEKSLIFYWRDPGSEVAEPLAALPVTALEPGGKNRLLLVGRWYDSDIQFCTGKPEWNADGTLREWLTAEVVYEGTIRFDEPQWFALDIPQGTPRLCLMMKRPWDDFWFTWPLTDRAPFAVTGYTFLTEVG